jgi:hypothetical protein
LFPKGTRLPDLLEDCYHLGPILHPLGKIVRVQAPAKIFDGKNLDQIKQWNDPFFGARIKLVPVPNMLFRPEEVHGTSGITKIFEPLPKWNGHVPH